MAHARILRVLIPFLVGSTCQKKRLQQVSTALNSVVRLRGRPIAAVERYERELLPQAVPSCFAATSSLQLPLMQVSPHSRSNFDNLFCACISQCWWNALSHSDPGDRYRKPRTGLMSCTATRFCNDMSSSPSGPNTLNTPCSLCCKSHGIVLESLVLKNMQGG